MIILRVLVKKLGLQIDMTELEGQAKEIETALKQAGDKDSDSVGSSEYIG
jgi:proteasome assembly chaperone (PAC2) family protein